LLGGSPEPLACLPTTMAVLLVPFLTLLTAFLGLCTRLQDAQGENEYVQEENSPSSSGRMRNVQLVPDDFCQSPKKQCSGSSLKTMRGMPQMFFNEFLEMAEGSFIPGPVNGWPGLRNLTVQTLTCKGHVGIHYLYHYNSPPSSRFPWRELLNTAVNTPWLCKSPISIRCGMTSPSWSNFGWMQTSPGFAFSFQPFHSSGPRVTAGGNGMANSKEQETAVRAHLFSHRYATEKESFFDSWLAWHSGILLEWNHGEFATVIELAWLGGLGGYKGQSNWYDDMQSKNGTLLYNSMPDCMKEPWDTSRNEIRMLDVKPNSVKAFREYLMKYSEAGKLPQEEQRFLEPKFPVLSGKVLPHRPATRADIGRYLVNYNLAAPQYSREFTNCQTFAADLLRFLTGKSASVETVPLRLTYWPQTQRFTQRDSWWHE